MRSRSTEAWLIRRGEPHESGSAELVKDVISIPDPAEGQVVVEPLFGCWEANMAHAIDRRPVDICAQRREPFAVLGNSGVVRAVEVGPGVEWIAPGRSYLFFGTGVADQFGYMQLAHAYDAPGTIGLLARQTLVPARNLFEIPDRTSATLEQWAAFSLRYLTAWSNWHVAVGCFRTQLSVDDLPHPQVWGWGGGTTFAELELARLQGCESTMISANPHHLDRITAAGLGAVDRREFSALAYDVERYRSDADYRSAYKAAEARFLAIVAERTNGTGVQIFVDYIGPPTFRATQKALGRMGVITSAGWKHGMETTSNRAMEAIARHIHVHTHYARFADVIPAMTFAEEHGWFPDLTETTTYDYDDIPTLARDYATGATGYFPIYRVNSSG